MMGESVRTASAKGNPVRLHRTPKTGLLLATTALFLLLSPPPVLASDDTGLDCTSSRVDGARIEFTCTAESEDIRWRVEGTCRQTPPLGLPTTIGVASPVVEGSGSGTLSCFGTLLGSRVTVVE